ncbi:MAG TPA: hypothetical protein VNH83_18090 [Bryobacteraceae bacterium]|nr:hypothetical protein [Bryobacteraceae bacterium]
MKWSRLLILFVPLVRIPAAMPPSPAPEAVVDTYTAISREQGARLRGATMEVEIEANLPQLKKQGRLQALRHISRLGHITYEAIRFEGDKTVKSNIIARYLAAEAEVQSGDESLLAVTPANYKFKYKGHSGQDENQIYIFQLTPRRKRVGLFKGELWIDAATCLPVRESGRLVKTPSIFLKRVEFVREYYIRGDVAVPLQIASTVETRLVGRAEVTVHFRNVELASDSTVTLAAASGQ